MKQLMTHLSVFFTFILMPRFAAAECRIGEGLCNPLAFGTLDEFLVRLLGLITQIAFPIVVLFIVYIGFRFVQESAAGNADKMKDLRNLFFWAIVGALLVLGAQALSFAIQATVGELTP